MDTARGGVDMPQITVQIGSLDFPPAPVFLHQFKEPGKLRTIFPAPFRQQNHGLIIRRFLILGRGFHHRQAEVIVKITFESGGGGVGPDLHVADDKGDLLSDFERRASASACFCSIAVLSMSSPL